MKNLLRSFSLLLAVVLLASLCACRLQGTPQPSDEASAPTVPSEEPTAPVTEKPEPAGGRSECAFQFSLFLDYAQRGVGRQPADNDDGCGGQWCWLLFSQRHQ